LLSKFDSTVQQGLFGLHSAYQHSSVGVSVQTVGNKFAANAFVNNTLLFLSWGLVGLAVYSVVEGVAHELQSADLLWHELNFLHGRRSALIESVSLRTLVRLLALGACWLLLRLTVYRLTPFAIASAHDTALHPGNPGGWARSLAAGAAIALATHGLTVLLRLAVLRSRLFGNEIVE